MGIIGDGLEILGLIDKAKNADVYRQLGDYIDKVREQQIENDQLHTEIRVLKDQLRFKGSIERIKSRTFVQGDDEQICPRCAEVDRIPVHLMMLPYPKPPYVRATCPACKAITEDNRPLTDTSCRSSRVSPSPACVLHCGFMKQLHIWMPPAGIRIRIGGPPASSGAEALQWPELDSWG